METTNTTARRQSAHTTILACALLLACLVGCLTGCATGGPSSSGNTQAPGQPANAGEIIGIIGAMDAEVDHLKKASGSQGSTEIAGMEFCEGAIAGKRVVVVKCGMGKVNAGICAHTLINYFGCTKVVNTGVAGSLDERLDIGDLVVSTDAVQHDYDVTPLGFAKGEIPYTGLSAFPADERLRAAAVEAAREASSEIHVFEGRVCSGDQFIKTKEQRDEITSNFGGLCCEMEGAAVAQTCYLNDVPFVVIRAISDNPSKTEIEDYRTFEARAALLSATLVERMMENID